MQGGAVSRGHHRQICLRNHNAWYMTERTFTSKTTVDLGQCQSLSNSQIKLLKQSGVWLVHIVCSLKRAHLHLLFVCEASGPPGHKRKTISISAPNLVVLVGFVSNSLAFILIVFQFYTMSIRTWLNKMKTISQPHRPRRRVLQKCNSSITFCLLINMETAFDIAKFLYLFMYLLRFTW